MVTGDRSQARFRAVALAFALLAAPAWASAQSALKLQWDASASAAGYELSYGLQSGTYTTTIDVGSTTTAVTPALQPGHWYYFAVRAYDATGLRSPYSTEVSGFTASITSLTANRGLPTAPGVPVTWTATPAAGSPALDYEFWLVTGTTKVLLRGYSSSASYTWTPTNGDVGTHTVEVWARVPAAAAPFEALYDSLSFSVVGTGPFTDSTLTPRVTLIRAVHIAELRARIDQLRVQYGLSPFAWTDLNLTAGTTRIKAQHILELRTAISDVYRRLNRTPPSFTDPGLGAGTVIKAAHIAELRAAVTALQ